MTAALHPPARTLTRSGRERDNQRQRVYDHQSAWTGDSALAVRHLVNGPKVPSTGSVSIPACQAYVDAILASAWFMRRWGRRHIQVGHKAYGNATWDGRDISLPPWARGEDVILHEMAHALNVGGYAPHGPEFVGIFLELVRYTVGPEAYAAQRAAFRAGRVRVSRAAVPEPRMRTYTAPRKATPEHASPSQQREAARILRLAIRDGRMGAVGTRSRTAALETARRLEQP